MRLHIRNFPFDVTADDLRALYESFGVVTDHYIILDRETRQSRGFAYVEFPNIEEAQTAIECLNDYEWRGRRLFVNEATRARGVSLSAMEREIMKRKIYNTFLLSIILAVAPVCVREKVLSMTPNAT
jgi:RNA recognition motif-containing protein